MTETDTPRPCILLVDDEELNRRFLRLMLENLGLQVVEAGDGATAVSGVQAQRIDLVLMDIRMPVMDGLDASRAIRKLTKAEQARVPILALTGAGYSLNPQLCREAGIDAVLAKPVDPQQLTRELFRRLPQARDSKPPAAAPEPAAGQEALAAALPMVDVAAGRRCAGGNTSAYQQFLLRFAAQFADFGQDLQNDLAAGDLPAAGARLHNLKGVAGNLGAERLMQTAARLEDQLATDPTADPDPLLQELQQLFQAIDPLLPPSGSSEPVRSGSSAELRQLLGDLLNPLRQLQVQQVKPLLDRIRQTNWPAAEQLRLNSLQQLIEGYRYADAAQLIETLLSGKEQE